MNEGSVNPESAPCRSTPAERSRIPDSGLGKDGQLFCRNQGCRTVRMLQTGAGRSEKVATIASPRKSGFCGKEMGAEEGARRFPPRALGEENLGEPCGFILPRFQGPAATQLRACESFPTPAQVVAALATREGRVGATLSR